MSIKAVISYSRCDSEEMEDAMNSSRNTSKLHKLCRAQCQAQRPYFPVSCGEMVRNFPHVNTTESSMQIFNSGTALLGNCS